MSANEPPQPLNDNVTVLANDGPGSTCALCLEDRPVLKSHIIPAFVVRHLKATSPTGFLRTAESGDRVQDIATEPLLCADCEQRFSQWERTFSLKAFPKIQGDDFDSFEYDEQLSKFATSLAWRVMRSERDDLVEVVPEWLPKIDATLENWRQYLLDLRQSPTSEMHLFVVPGIPLALPKGTHPKTLQYLFRAIDATVLDGSQNLAVYVKLIRTIFYAPVVPASPSGWVDTRIHNGPGTLISAHQKLTAKGFLAFIQSRVKAGFDDPLSPKALKQIMKAVNKKPEALLGSEAHQVHIASKHLLNQDGNEEPG